MLLLNPPDPNQDIVTRFREVARCVPDHPAVVDEASTTSYAALDASSDRLAAQLVARFGHEPEPVALLLPNTVSAVTGILGVLKAGKFYVPLDPLTQAGACRIVLQTSAAKILLTISNLLPLAYESAPLETEIVTIDTLELDTPVAVPALNLTAESYASVLFTSGSTGQPKGVIWHHGGWLNRARQSHRYEQLGPQDRVNQVFSPAFALYSTIGFVTLLNGATLCIHSSDISRLIELFDWLAEQSITVFFAPVSLLRDLLASSQSLRRLPAVRAVVLGGQPFLARELIGLADLVSPDCVIINRLSMSELLLVTRYVIGLQDIQPTANPVPIGYAVEENEVMVWDENGHPVKTGQVGQIAVRSRYLSPGYWRNPELTAAKFLPDPDGGDQRILLTGDLGCLRPDGCLEYRGRQDLMVKIRGYRVEPESIQATLMAHPDIRECVVVPRPSRNGEPRLMAYLAPHQLPGPTASELHDRLARSLPTYMIPARFIVLENLPRNANGKIDRQNLPPLGTARPELDTPFVAPHTELEQQIADVWIELLEFDEVGLDDNFFELGGDSLTALRLLLEIEEQFGVKVESEFFHDPTIAHLVRLLSLEQSAPPAPLAVSRKTPSASRTHALRKRRLIERGPLLRGRALPYGLGVCLQRAWLATPGIRQTLFRHEIELLRRWGNLVGEQQPEAAIRRSLLANTWGNWRNHVLGVPLGTSPWVTVRGDPTLWQPQCEGPGVIFLVMHSHLSTLFMHSLHSGGCQFVLIKSAQPNRRSSLVYQAYQALQRNETVIIAGDGRFGQSGITLPFFGGKFVVRPGGAELAVQTGARLAAVFATMALDGRVTFDVCSLTTAVPGSHEAQVEALTRAYGELMIQHWSQVYTSQRWGHLQGKLERNVMSAE